MIVMHFQFFFSEKTLAAQICNAGCKALTGGIEQAGRTVVATTITGGAAYLAAQSKRIFKFKKGIPSAGTSQASDIRSDNATEFSHGRIEKGPLEEFNREHGTNFTEGEYVMVSTDAEDIKGKE